VVAGALLHCPWDTSTCAFAAEGWHLEVLRLRWARGHDCPWGGRTRKYAAECGHTELRRWAGENGCPSAVADADAVYGGGRPAGAAFMATAGVKSGQGLQLCKSCAVGKWTGRPREPNIFAF